MKLPNCEKAFVDIRKLTGYCLNITHERGKHKARLFSSILGFTSDNAMELKEILLEAARSYNAEKVGEDSYGKRYLIDFTITRGKGQAKVRSAWIVRSYEDFARLASCYILK